MSCVGNLNLTTLIIVKHWLPDAVLILDTSETYKLPQHVDTVRMHRAVEINENIVSLHHMHGV